MKIKNEYEQLLTVILEDLRVCLQYTPHRENDLLCFMEQYIKASNERRLNILKNLRDCMDNKEYPNPYAAYLRYGENEIKHLEKLLTDYIQDMQIFTNKEIVLTNVIANLNEMQDRCCGQLIDNWRKEHLINFLVLIAEDVSLNCAIEIINIKSRW